MATLVQDASASFASISRAMEKLAENAAKQKRITEGTRSTGGFLLEMQSAPSYKRVCIRSATQEG